jgi:hypothetical protein
VVGLTGMRRVLPFLVLTAVMAGTLPAAAAVQPTGFAFGRLGGNIRPYTVTIANSGTVHTTGAVVVGRKHLTSPQLASLNRVATETQFATLPKATSCSGSMADIAATYVRVAARTVRVHGACLPRYQRLLKALEASVQIAG